MAKNHGQEQPKVLTSDEMNYLIYRYLQECGFHHSAFTFAHESHMASVAIDPNMVPPAALVTFVQKGLQYMEAEANIDPETQEIAKEFSTLSTVDLLTKDIDELRHLALSQKEEKQAQIQGALAQQQHPQPPPQQQQQQQLKVKRSGAKRERATAQQQQQQKSAAAEDEQPQPQQPTQRARQRPQQTPKQAPQLKQEQQQQEQEPQQQQQQPQRRQQQQGRAAAAAAAAAEAAAAADGAAPMDEDHPAAGGDGLEIQQTEEHEGSSAEAFICYWSPTDLLLLTGSSGDPFARVWDFSPAADHSKPMILSLPEQEALEAKDVCAADWHPSGNTLACGSFNGAIRIWRKDGTMDRLLSICKGPLLTLKWQKRGDLLLAGSSDVGTHVVDAHTWRVKQTFIVHTGATLDADWRDDTSFATCCNDGTIAVCKLGSDKAIKTFSGGKSEVNMVRWDPSGELLASGSDDRMVRVWRMSQDTPIAVFEHMSDIYSIRWSPKLPSDGQGPVLGTASLDKSVRLWDVHTGRELMRLDLPDSSYCLCFSPDGKYVAGGCMDGVLRFWTVANGRQVAAHTGDGHVLDVSWCRSADKVAFTTATKKVVVLHLKRT